MNLCPRGHDKDRVGVTRAYRCRTCDIEEKRARRARAGRPTRPTGMCQSGLHPKTGPRCQACVKARQIRSSEARRLRPRKPRINVKGPRIAVDGFEAEFGPVPLPRPGIAWVDRVALARTLSGQPVGRNLTPGETRALHLLSVIRKDGT